MLKTGVDKGATPLKSFLQFLRCYERLSAYGDRLPAQMRLLILVLQSIGILGCHPFLQLLILRRYLLPEHAVKVVWSSRGAHGKVAAGAPGAAAVFVDGCPLR